MKQTCKALIKNKRLQNEIGGVLMELNIH